MRRNILCIDDIEENLFSLRLILEHAHDCNYEIITALSAMEAFEILKEKRIDLILCDVMMPEIDGFMATKMIKSNHKTKNIPVIFVTAKKDDTTIEECYDVGGVDYISKPFNSVELLKRVSFHLQLRNKERLLKKEKEYAEYIFNMQDNLIIISDGSLAVDFNKSAKEFFNIPDITEFQRDIGCVCSQFIREESFFFLKNEVDECSMDELIALENDNKDIVIKMEKEDDDYIFSLKVKQFYDKYIMVFTDITALYEQSKIYEHAANYDNLTQIYNRNIFNKLMNKSLKNLQATDEKLFVILDIDHFKDVNDTYGHNVGDVVLKMLAEVIKKNIRSDDVFARWGGEEFVLLMKVDLHLGLKIVENLRKTVEEMKIPEVGHITCSFGVTLLTFGDTIESTVQRADEALYEAKESGRNRVCHKI